MKNQTVRLLSVFLVTVWSYFGSDSDFSLRHESPKAILTFTVLGADIQNSVTSSPFARFRLNFQRKPQRSNFVDACIESFELGHGFERGPNLLGYLGFFQIRMMQRCQKAYQNFDKQL